MFNKFQKQEKKRKRLKTNLPRIYTILAFIIFIGFGFFYTSKIFFVDAADILNTDLGVKHNLNSQSYFVINEWIYDEETNKMQVTLLTSNLTDYMSDLKFISLARSNLKEELPTKIVYNTRDIYIIMIDDVPKNYNQLAVRFVKEEVNFDEIFAFGNDLNEEESAEVKEKILVSIYADHRVVKKGEVKQQKVKEYALKVTNEMIEDTEKKRRELMNDIQKNTLIISKIKEEIESLKQELIYQTTTEQDETNNKIFTLDKQIEDYTKKNAEILKDVDSLDSKINRLTQRKRDLQF